jgi:hypothetical protein
VELIRRALLEAVDSVRGGKLLALFGSFAVCRRAQIVRSIQFAEPRSPGLCSLIRLVSARRTAAFVFLFVYHNIRGDLCAGFVPRYRLRLS